MSFPLTAPAAPAAASAAAPGAAPAAARARRQPRQPIEVRRQQVLDAALRLISAHGYGAATMEAIAREARLAKPVVYKAYPSRGALLMALLEREERVGLAAIADALPELSAGTDLETTLVQAVSSFLSAVTQHPVTWRLMLLPADETPGEVRQHVDAGRAFALDRIRALLRMGVGRQARDETFDLELSARSLLALGEQAARLVLTDPDQFTPERYARYARQLLGALAPRRAPAAPDRAPDAPAGSPPTRRRGAG
jgi:AcrR family transcriptional regulator